MIHGSFSAARLSAGLRFQFDGADCDLFNSLFAAANSRVRIHSDTLTPARSAARSNSVRSSSVVRQAVSPDIFSPGGFRGLPRLDSTMQTFYKIRDFLSNGN